MEDASHLLQYRRFFAITISVLPGLELTYGLAALVLWLMSDVGGVDWSWGVGVAAITFAMTMAVWLFIGMAIQRWAEEKSGTLLFILNAPFLVVFLGGMVWLFITSVLGAHSPGAETTTSAVFVAEQLRALI